MVPCTYHGMAPHWYSELCHMFFAKLVVDLSPMDGKFAYAAVSNRIGYVGITFNEFHAQQLMMKVQEQVMNDMKDPSSKLFVPAFAKAVMGDEEVKPLPPMKKKPPMKRNPKAKADPKKGKEEEPEEEEGIPATPKAEEDDQEVWDPNDEGDEAGDEDES